MTKISLMMVCQMVKATIRMKVMWFVACSQLGLMRTLSIGDSDVEEANDDEEEVAQEGESAGDAATPPRAGIQLPYSKSTDSLLVDESTRMNTTGQHPHPCRGKLAQYQY